MLGRDCLRAIFRKQFPPSLDWLKNGFRENPEMGRENPEMGLKWVKSGFGPTFDPFLHPKTHFWTHFSPLTKTPS